PQRQRRRVHRAGDHAAGDDHGRGDAVHRAGQPVGERVRGELPRAAARRAAQRGSVRWAARREDAGGEVASRVQPPPPALVAEVPAPGHLRGDAGRASGRGCAPPSGPVSVIPLTPYPYPQTLIAAGTGNGGRSPPDAPREHPDGSGPARSIWTATP